MGSTKSSILVLVGFLGFLMPAAVLVNASCEFHESMALGRKYYIKNTQYPGKYSPSTYCTWYGDSPVGTKIVVGCEDIAIPSSTNCAGDKLAITLSGDANFRDARIYCRTGAVSLVTNANNLAMGLSATHTSPGGRFFCTLTAIENSDATTPPPPVCDCPWKGTRIVGGNETLINEFPSMAGLVDTEVRDVVCGGSIISIRYVLMAAHCLLNVNRENLRILVGVHNTSSGLDTKASALYKVSAYEMHPNFSRLSLINDIAILRTASNIRFGLHVEPVCLPFKYTTSDFLGETLTALGWGQTFFTGPKSDVLQKVDLSVTSNVHCTGENSDSIITPGQICTFSPGKDACQKDLEGPLLWMDTDKRRLQLVGLISYGLGCATGRPAINTRVTSYIPWIVSRTPDANYCTK